MINIKKILCEVIDEDDNGYIKVWELGMYLFFLALILCCTLFVASYVGYNIHNKFDTSCSADGLPLSQVITIDNAFVGTIAILIIIIILHMLYKILNMKIISCDLKGGK